MFPSFATLADRYLVKSFLCAPLSLLQPACDLLGTSTAFYAYLDEHYMHVQQVVHAPSAAFTCAITANSPTPLAAT